MSCQVTRSQPATSGVLSAHFVPQNQGEHVSLTDVRHHPGDAGHDDLRPPGHPACWQHDEGSTVAVSEVRALGSGIRGSEALAFVCLLVLTKSLVCR